MPVQSVDPMCFERMVLRVTLFRAIAYRLSVPGIEADMQMLLAGRIYHPPDDHTPWLWSANRIPTEGLHAANRTLNRRVYEGAETQADKHRRSKHCTRLVSVFKYVLRFAVDVRI